jgi:hypothetical protein
MLTAGHVLDDAVIKKITDFERSTDLRLTADVWCDPAAGSRQVK